MAATAKEVAEPVKDCLASSAQRDYGPASCFLLEELPWFLSLLSLAPY